MTSAGRGGARNTHRARVVANGDELLIVAHEARRGLLTLVDHPRHCEAELRERIAEAQELIEDTLRHIREMGRAA